METRPAEKKKLVIPAIFWIIFVVLIVTVIVQATYIARLNRDLKKESLSRESVKDNRFESIAANSSTSISKTSNSVINDKDKIKKLESKIADMQARQNYLEDTLQDPENAKKIWFNAMRVKDIKHNFVAYINQFAKITNLSPDMKENLLEMLPKLEKKILVMFPEDIPDEDKIYEMNNIMEKFDAEIAELLPEKHSEYMEYFKFQIERSDVERFNNSMLTGDDQLQEEQQQKLIDILYDDNQIARELYSEWQEEDKKPISNIDFLKENLELKKTLRSRYIESVRDILSESQMEKFQKFLDVEITNLEMNINFESAGSNKNETGR